MESPLGARTPTSSSLSRRAALESKKSRSSRRGETAQQNGDHQQQNGGDWVEPPLRTPVPSFLDYPGLSRQGVLETMMPLGTRPTTRVRAKSKGDPLRRIVQARNLGGDLIPDEGDGTPEPAVLSENTRAAVLRADGRSQRESPVTDVNMDSDVMSSPSRQSTRRLKITNMSKDKTMEQAANTPSPAKDFRAETPSTRYPGSFVHAPVPAGSPFFTAAAMANKNGKPEVQLPLAFLYSATEKDPELERLLQAAARDNSILDKHSEVSKKIKQVKNLYRNQNNGPLSRASSIAARLRGASGTDLTRGDNGHASHSLSHSPGVAAQTTTKPASQQPSFTPINSSHLSSSTVPKSLKIRLNNPSKPSVSNNISSSRTLSPSKEQVENSISHSRRSSSSSLSSVDSEVANQSSPTMAKRVAKKQTATNPAAGRKRKIEEAEPYPVEDPEVEERRKRLRESLVKEPEAPESNIRHKPTVPLNLTSQSTFLSHKKHKKHKKSSHRHAPDEVDEDDSNELADLSGSRKRTATPTALGRPPKKPRTKISPIKVQKRPAAANLARPESSQTAGASFGNKDDLSESSENHDYCSACGNPGYLVCCDGCDRAYHFDCLHPPVTEKDLVGGKWFCSVCEAKREAKYRGPGIFVPLKQHGEKFNPKAFSLPPDLRKYFKNAKTGSDGEYEEDPDVRPAVPTRGAAAQTHEARYRALKDSKGNWILCHSCGKSSGGTRDIVQCDYCSLYWHLDCLNPPRANVPVPGVNVPDSKRLAWKCPAHADHDLRTLDPKESSGPMDGLAVLYQRVREPKMTRTVQTNLTRGLANNGLIEVESDSEDDTFQEEEAADGVKYKLPRKGIMLDFIDKVKWNRLKEEQLARERVVALQEEAAKISLENAARLKRAISSRGLKERIAAFNLARFRSENTDLKLAGDEVENLIAELEVQAPEEVVEEFHAAEGAAGSSGQPPLSGVAPTERQRMLLQRMQEQIQKLLATEA